VDRNGAPDDLFSQRITVGNRGCIHTGDRTHKRGRIRLENYRALRCNARHFLPSSSQVATSFYAS
jgi:hypothetical protein